MCIMTNEESPMTPYLRKEERKERRERKRKERGNTERHRITSKNPSDEVREYQMQHVRTSCWSPTPRFHVMCVFLVGYR